MVKKRRNIALLILIGCLILHKKNSLSIAPNSVKKALKTLIVIILSLPLKPTILNPYQKMLTSTTLPIGWMMKLGQTRTSQSNIPFSSLHHKK